MAVNWVEMLGLLTAVSKVALLVERMEEPKVGTMVHWMAEYLAA